MSKRWLIPLGAAALSFFAWMYVGGEYVSVVYQGKTVVCGTISSTTFLGSYAPPCATALSNMQMIHTGLLILTAVFVLVAAILGVSDRNHARARQAAPPPPPYGYYPQP